MGGIPDGWMDYSKIGKPMKLDDVAATFVSFKVPLKSQLTSKLDEDQVFTPETLLTTCKAQNINLGLIIDLTFTSRYYQPSAFEKAGVMHVKIPIEGKMVPKRARAEKFAETVKQFLEESKDKDAVIGVHCTHGLNRTGYMICKYLMDHENMSANKAIELFNSCRGHDIERENYLKHLQTGELPVAEKTSYYNGEYTDSNWGKPKGADTYHNTGANYSHNTGANSSNWRSDSNNYSHYNSDPYYSHHVNDSHYDSRNGYYNSRHSNYNQGYSNYYYPHNHNYQDDNFGDCRNYSSFEPRSTSRNDRYPQESSYMKRTHDNQSYGSSSTTNYRSNDGQQGGNNPRQYHSGGRRSQQSTNSHIQFDEMGSSSGGSRVTTSKSRGVFETVLNRT